MTIHSGCQAVTGGLLAVALFAAQPVLSADFTIVPDQSSVSLSGKAIGFALQEQGPGSLTTKYEGVIRAEVGETIRFIGGSVIAAQNNGSWQPLTGGQAGSAAANYGGKANAGILGTATAAARNLQIDVISGALPLNGTAFESTSLVFSFITNAHGVLDYVVTGFVPRKDSLLLAGYATNRITTSGTLVTSGNEQTLTIPITADFKFKLLTDNDTELTVTGQLVAKRTLGDPAGSFDTWVAAQFPGITDPAVIGPHADPDKDGLPNILEFALGLEPGAPSSSGTVFAGKADPANPGQVSFEYVRPKGLNGASLNYLVQSSEDLFNWSATAGEETVVDLGNGKERVTVKRAVPSGARAFFQRLAVSPK